jgi:serine/threonine protein kinase
MPEWSVPGYTAIRSLGSGGFGEVVLARHDDSGVLVAIKYLRSELLSDPGFAGMFRGEAQVLASMDDPNIVRLYEYVEAPSGAAIVMELVNGVPLREILTHQGKTAPEAALVVLEGSLLGLAAAHQRGVVHRDYKPENVLVNGQGLSKLTDFGLAARTGDHPVPAGTLAYVAPEQIDGAPASPASDVYAATATFYECLTGRPPFSGKSADLLHQHRTTAVPLDTVPPPLRPLIAAGMAKDPQRRPADAITFITQLQTAASSTYGKDWAERGRSHLAEAALLLAALWPTGAPLAAPGTAVDRIPLHRRISPAKAAIAAGTVIAVAAAGTALAVSREHRHRPPSQPAAVVQPIPLQPATSTRTNLPTPTATVVTPTRTTITPTVMPPTTIDPSPSLSPSLSSSPSQTTPPPPPPPCTPQIATVGPFQAAATQTVQISGRCFGSGNTSSGTDTAYFRISDLTAGWNACWTNDPGTDSVTCDVSSWANQQITFSGYTGDYGQPGWVVTQGDDIEIQVWNPQSGNGPATCMVVAGSGSPTNCSGG